MNQNNHPSDARTCILVLDSLGIGASFDAPSYGDAGADTFGHIWQACQEGRADIDGVRQGALNIPNLKTLGLCHANIASTGSALIDLSEMAIPDACFGYAVEQSVGKDTPSGHWEMAGLPVPYEWGLFTHSIPCFPDDLIDQLIEKGHITGVLGNKHASGTTILDELGDEHMKTGKPIVYTSADSVFQIAAHEETFGLQRLYQLCELARTLVDPLNIGRVIARPFIGKPGAFKRTGNRRDYATPPHGDTLLDVMIKEQREVIAIGKISDIFAHRGISQSIKADGNMAIFDATIDAFKQAPDGSLVFSNFVDFDSSYGHRRDIAGYAKALEDFDKRLPLLLKQLRPHDLLILTADHGCDPTFPGSDHTREHIPVLAYSPSLPARFIGRRESFADIGQSVADWLSLPVLSHGISFCHHP